VLKASCVFTDIFATLFGRPEMKWARPTTSCSLAPNTRADSRAQNAKPHPFPPKTPNPLCYHLPPPMHTIVHARISQTKNWERTKFAFVCLLQLFSSELPTFVRRVVGVKGGSGEPGFTDGRVMVGHAYMCKYNHYAGPL